MIMPESTHGEETHLLSNFPNIQKGTLRAPTKIDSARAAFKRRDVSASKSAHLTHSSLPKRTQERHSAVGDIIKAFVFGGLDGIITIFALVASVEGAKMQPRVVLILGLATLIADGISMAVGEWASETSELDWQKAERAREEWEVSVSLDEEKREMVEIYEERGLSKEDSTTIVDIISKDEKVFVDLMMLEELGIIVDEDANPLKSSAVMFFSFTAFGSIPLLSYIVALLLGPTAPTPSDTFVLSVVFTGITLFMLGSAKERLTRGAGTFEPLAYLRGGLFMVLMGGVSASAAYAVGLMLKRMIDIDI